MVLVEDAAGAEQVAGEGDALLVDVADEHAAAVGVALGGDDLEVDVAPGEGLVILEVGVDGDVLGEGEEGVAVVVVVVDAFVLPEEFGLVEEVAFVLGDGDFGTVFAEAWGAPGLVAVVVGVEDPLDLADADFFQVVDEGAGAGVDEDGAVAGGYAVGVAGVGEAEDAGEIWVQDMGGWGALGSGGRVREGKEIAKSTCVGTSRVRPSWGSHMVWLLHKALQRTRSLRIQATRATLGGLPAAMRRW